MKTFNITQTNQLVIFTIDTDVFEAVSADSLQASAIAEYFQEINKGNLFKAHDNFLKTVLIEDSYKRFNNRLNSKEEPITINILGDVTSWLIGDEYLGGKSFGRGQAIITFALDAWDEFDSWCLMHGIQDNPWNLPSYRFGSLVIAFMKEDKTPESIEKIDNALDQSDILPHPFRDTKFKIQIKAMCNVLTNNLTKSSVTIDNVIYDSRLVEELPIEERKRREAAAAGKPYRVPEWWRGEKANYKTAQSMMKTLPKKFGPVKD